MNRLKIIIFILLVSSCAGNNDDKTNAIEVDLAVNIDNAEKNEIKLSELADDFRVVNLETKESALLNIPTGFAVTDDYILVVDMEKNPAKLFTGSGKFVNEIGNIGSGPDEYLTVVSPHINTADTSLYLLLGGNYFHARNGWVYNYNISGEIINRINTSDKSDDRNANRVLMHDNRIIIPGNVDSRDMIIMKSIDNEEVIRVKNRIPRDYFTYTTNTSIVYPFGGNYHFKIGESDTIYSLSVDGAVKPVAIIFTRKYVFDEAKIKDARSTRGSGRFENILAATEGCYSIKLLGETNRYYILFVTINGKDQSTRLLTVDKESGESSFTEIINDYLFDISVDRQPFIYNNEYLIFHYPAVIFLKALKEKSEATKENNIINDIERMRESINQDDNDILLICRLKL